MYQTRIHNGKKKGPKHRALIYPEDGDQRYAVVQQMMGNGRVKVLCEDKLEYMARIRGSMRKHGNKTLIEKGDLVIVAGRGFEEDKVDLIHKYNYDEGTYLAQGDILPANIKRAWTNSIVDVDGVTAADDAYITFGEDDTASRRRETIPNPEAVSDPDIDDI